MDELILLTYKDEAACKGPAIRISNETYEILKQFSQRSRLPMAVVLNRMVMFASERTTVKEI